LLAVMSSAGALLAVAADPASRPVSRAEKAAGRLGADREATSLPIFTGGGSGGRAVILDGNWLIGR
jgi:hypothetical protein